MTTKEIVERISYFRLQKNISARELSQRIGKHETYINKLECKDFNLPTKMLLEIIDALEISVEDFFCLGKDYTEDGKTLLIGFNKLNNTNKQTILDLVNKLQ